MRKLWILVSLILSQSVVSHGQDIACEATLSFVAEHNLSLRVNEKEFFIEDPKTKSSIHGGVDSKGYLYFGIRTRDQAGLPLTDFMRGKHLFDLLFNHFSSNIRRIEGHWWNGAGPSTNLDQLKKYMSPPFSLPLPEAAKKTFTGERSVERGFTKVRISEVKKDGSGNIIDIVVHFCKPDDSGPD